MRALQQELRAHLEGGVTTLCRCWRIVRTDGVVLGFTDHDRELSFLDVTFSSLDGFEASSDVTKTGLGVGGLEIEGAFSSDAIETGDLQDGRYDGSRITLWLVNWADVSQRAVLRLGVLGEVRRSDNGFWAEVRGPMHALETIRGRVISRQCGSSFGGSSCGVDIAAAAKTVTVTNIDGARITVTGINGKQTAWATGGTAVVTSGSANGMRRIVTKHAIETTGVVLTLLEPILDLNTGDQLEVTPGCNKSSTDCASKHGNSANFQGFPHLPGNDKALGYARAKS
ncbi:MAG: DUF2163 domain-containing protein [Pseudomonadota bacterium]